jgi:hypothetical protein
MPNPAFFTWRKCEASDYIQLDYLCQGWFGFSIIEVNYIGDCAHSSMRSWNTKIIAY